MDQLNTSDHKTCLGNAMSEPLILPAGIDPLQHVGETDLGGKSRQRFWLGNVSWDVNLWLLPRN